MSNFEAGKIPKERGTTVPRQTYFILKSCLMVGEYGFEKNAR